MPSRSDRMELHGLRLPELKEGDDLPRAILSTVESTGIGIRDGDVLVVASKVISKVKGYLARISEVEPSLRSKILAKVAGRPAWLVELIRRVGRIVLILPFSEASRGTGFPEEFSRDPNLARAMVEEEGGTILADVGGVVITDAGIDWSNCPEGVVALPPPDPDAEAREIADRIRELTGARVGVVISDTDFAPFRMGSVDWAIGVSGIDPVRRSFGDLDLYGKPKFGGVDLVADELAAAAALLMGQSSEGIPVVLVRGAPVTLRDDARYSMVTAPVSNMGRAFFKGLLKTALAKILRLG
ncbi:MAG: hypothetical protein DRO01_06285 [Thermoproteota archaeon]|nr:MAG: hypothetical protein DRO01_06285 [Candidatus Korarchaeota archaeon]